MELRQLPGDLRDGALAVLQRPEPVAQALEPGLDAGQRRLRVAGRQLGQPGLERREPREDRLDGGVLLGIEPGQLPGDLGEGVLGALDRREPALQRLQPLGEAVEKRARVALGQPLLHLGEAGLERRQAGQHRLDAGVLLGVEPGELVGDPGERALAGVLQRRDPALHRFQPLGEAVEKRARVALGQPLLHLGEPGLERRQAGQHRLDAGVLLGVEPGQLLGDRREGGLGRVLQRGEPLGQPGERRLRVAAAELGLERADAAGELGRQRLLLGVQPGELLGERPHRGAGLGLEPGELALRGGALGLQRLDAAFEPLQRLAPGLERPEPGLDRPEPGLRRLGALFAALLQLDQPLGEPGGVARGRGGQRREPGLERGGAGGLRRLQLVDPALQRLEERPRLGGLAHLLERPHPGAELVEAGERGLQRGVLVADQAEELAGHRLQPLLRGVALGGQGVEPEREIRLGRGQRLQPLGGAARPRAARSAPASRAGAGAGGRRARRLRRWRGPPPRVPRCRSRRTP